MAKSILGYSLGKIEPRLRLRFNQELYGYIDRSNHGHYKYKRKGILSDIEYDKPLDSILVVPTKIANLIVKHFKKYKANHINFKIKG